MWGWILLILGILIFLLVVFKYKEISHKVGWTFLAVLFIFLVLSVYQVYSTTKPDLTTLNGVSSVANLYFVWLGNLAGQVMKVSTFAVHQDWGLNVTNSTG